MDYIYVAMVTKTKIGLLEKLIQIQGAETDSKFAQRLQVSRSLWVQVTKGTKGIGRTLLTGIINAFPELEPEILEFLRNNENSQAKRRPGYQGQIRS